MLLSLLLIVNGLNPIGIRFDAVGRLNWYCSATLVRPDVILTARHCVYEQFDSIVYFRTEETIAVDHFYLPESGDAALGYLASTAQTVQPIQMDFAGADPQSEILLSGTGQTGLTKICLSWVTYTDSNSYIMFPSHSDPTGPGCGPDSGDSGGAVVVEGQPLKIVSVIVGTTISTNLEQYASDPVFNPSSINDDAK